MDREDDREVTAYFLEGAEELVQGVRVVHVRGAMQRQDRVALSVEWQPVEDGRGLPARLERQQRVDHDIADEMDLRGRDALPKKVDPGVFLGDEEQIRDGVREQAVDFFRHRPVEAAEPRLDVDEREAELDGGDGGGQGGVHVADAEYECGPYPGQQRLQTLHDLRSLDGVGARSDTEVVVRCRDLQLGEEPRRHRVVVVLTGVNERRDDRRMAQHFPDEWTHLHEIGPRPHDVDDLHGRMPPTAARHGPLARGCPTWRSGYRPRARRSR